MEAGTVLRRRRSSSCHSRQPHHRPQCRHQRLRCPSDKRQRTKDRCRVGSRAGTGRSHAAGGGARPAGRSGALDCLTEVRGTSRSTGRVPSLTVGRFNLASWGQRLAGVARNDQAYPFGRRVVSYADELPCFPAVDGECDVEGLGSVGLSPEGRRADKRHERIEPSPIPEYLPRSSHVVTDKSPTAVSQRIVKASLVLAEVEAHRMVSRSMVRWVPRDQLPLSFCGQVFRVTGGRLIRAVAQPRHCEWRSSSTSEPLCGAQTVLRSYER